MSVITGIVKAFSHLWRFLFHASKCMASNLFFVARDLGGGLKAASLAVVPSHLAVGLYCVVTGCALVSDVFPLRSQIRMEGLQQIAVAGLAASTTRAS